MKKGTFKWIAIAIAVIVILLFLQRCGKGVFGCNRPDNDTIQTRIDTFYVHQKADVVYIPVPDTIIIRHTERDTAYIPSTPDTIYAPEYIVVDTALILRDYFAAKYYSDTAKVQYGSVIIQDTVSENKITSRRLITDFNIPLVKESSTIIRKKNIAYIGFSGQGSKQNFLFSVGADLSLKTKNDRIWSAGASLTRDNQVLYGAGIKFPIRLKK